MCLPNREILKYRNTILLWGEVHDEDAHICVDHILIRSVNEYTVGYKSLRPLVKKKKRYKFFIANLNMSKMCKTTI